MEIRIWGYELREMIKDHVEITYGLDLSGKDLDIQELNFIYTEREIVHKKHANGKVKKDKNGCWLIDEDKTKYVTKYAGLNDDAELCMIVY